jgi:hypothetical protein
MLLSAAEDEAISSIEASCSSEADATFCELSAASPASLVSSLMEAPTCSDPAFICSDIADTS